MKRFIHAKNIVLWLAALFVIVTAMILLCGPFTAVLKGEMLNESLKYDPFEYSYRLKVGGTTTIDLTKTKVWDFLPSSAPEYAKITIDNNVLFGPVLILLGGLAIVGLTFLKPCKLRGWGFILCIAIIITGLVFYIIRMIEVDKECHEYFKQTIKYMDSNGEVQEMTYATYVGNHKIEFNKITYYVIRLHGHFEVNALGSVAVWLLFPALPLLIVGMALRVRRPREAKPLEQPVEQPAPAAEQPVESAPVEEPAPVEESAPAEKQ